MSLRPPATGNADLGKLASQAFGRRRIGTAIAIAILLAAISSSPALASPQGRSGRTVIPGYRYSSFHLRGTNGYELDVSTVGADHLAVELFSGPNYVSYLTPAKIGHDRVEAKIGGLGRIMMEFKPSGPPQKSTEPQGECRGRRPLGQYGVFKGWFGFRGERGFTAVKANRVEGYREESFREVCKGGGRNGYAEEPPLEPDLAARASRGDRAVSVEIFLKPEELSTHAAIRERRGRLEIERMIGIAGERGLYLPQSDGSALITPPAPFTGEAEYRPEALAGAPWTGTLSAPFPGLGVVRLAGNRFEVLAHPGRQR
jgi:hypothetical protein